MSRIHLKCEWCSGGIGGGGGGGGRLRSNIGSGANA